MKALKAPASPYWSSDLRGQTCACLELQPRPSPYLVSLQMAAGPQCFDRLGYLWGKPEFFSSLRSHAVPRVSFVSSSCCKCDTVLAPEHGRVGYPSALDSFSPAGGQCRETPAPSTGRCRPHMATLLYTRSLTIYVCSQCYMKSTFCFITRNFSR